eukprot:TRINITY_DN742_c0_g5_i1.p1 TRINITY_DN742_c0_g5~~TRINITY_DN742_c0_g5_i1.p1  ORF type:complete len:532 (+),score=191.37 TRINITY_DN742_c0_g5_i1:39-1634(+)
MFTVLVASDLFGEKVNLEVEFAMRPSLKQLGEMVEKCYGIEVEERKGSRDVGRYKTSRFQVFEEGRGKWVDLVSGNQLSEYCQLYAFQQPNPWHKEVRAAIPAPVKAKLASHASALAVPDDPSHDEKVSAIFDDMDLNNDRHIDSDEFHRCCSLASLPFTTATITDLFLKADLNQDSLVSYSEFQRFAELYPSLIDSLYHRLKFYWEDMRLQGEMDAVKDAIQAAHENERHAKAAFEDRVKDVAAAEARLATQEREVHVKVDKLRRCEDDARDAAREVDRNRKEFGIKEQDLALQKEKERIKAQGFEEYKQETEKALQRTGHTERDIGNVESYLRQTEQLHSDYVSGAEREGAKTQSAAHELQKAHDGAKIGAEQRRQAEQEVADTILLLTELDNKIGIEQQEVKAAQLRHNAANENVNRCSGIKQEEQNLLQSHRDREQELNAERMAAERRSEAAAMDVKTIEDQNNEFHNEISETNERERPLLEQEIRLREQRDSLELKETALRTDQKTFYHHNYQPGAGTNQTSLRRK